jgi:large subunit ribosomal protein L24
MSARLRKGDTVVVISGKDRKKTGEVIQILAEDNKVVVKGINVVKRNMRPTQRNQQGGIVEKELPIHASKVMPVDPKTGKGTRVKMKVVTLANGKKSATRIAKSGEAITNAPAGKAAAAAKAKG